MSTPFTVNVGPACAGVYHVSNIPKETFETGTRLLQANHERHHVFFNDRGFHNHISHYLLTLVALGATPTQIQRAYVQEQALQRPHYPIDEHTVQQMNDEEFFISCLSQEQHYHNYLAFFKQQIAEHGVGPVVQEQLFSNKPTAQFLFSRMFASILHPLIHLGFGIEFDQPAIIAEGLAQAAVHQPEVSHFFNAIEASSNYVVNQPGRPMIDLIREIANNDKIRNAEYWGDGSFIVDELLIKAPKELWDIAAQWRVSARELNERTAEMIHVNTYFTAAAQIPHKEHKLDFFLIHNVNCSIFFSAILQKDWLTIEDKVRLLEWKGRFDIISYAARGSPSLRSEEVMNYSPKKPTTEWGQLFKRVNAFSDDSHVCKLIRALANGAQACKPYEGNPRFPMKNDMFLQAAHIALDSTENTQYLTRWVRGAGFKPQWEKFADRAPKSMALVP
ncbi:hypothetical protein BKA66DRAFT_595891 [Pyrenochaeta sp. MPI-SDFR-AT-0127]|nr:hypothetical protein BKA66DRAFT_595891 [Pyrenochaeta sp. MPI-SDFR-AT-0127]